LKDFKVELLYTVPKDEQGSWVNLCADPRGRLIVSDQTGSLYRVTLPSPGSKNKLKVERIPIELGQAHGLLWVGDVLYVVEERAPGRPPLVTDVGVRLPAHLTASGRAILAALPSAQVRALFPDKESFVDRHGNGPTSLSALRVLLAETRQRGYAAEDGEVTPGFASVAAAVMDHNDLPVAGVAVTWPSQHEILPLGRLVRATRDTAHRLTRRLGGNPVAPKA